MQDLDAASVRRAVIQKLEGFQRAGLTHWNRITPLPIAADSVTSASIVGPDLIMPEPRGNQVSLAHFGTMSAMSRVNPAAPTENSSLPTAAMFEPLNLPRSERISQLALLAERVGACIRCQELVNSRKQTVFGVGNPEAKILFIGEAPGADEDAQGEPFVGRAGQLLNEIIKACRMKREDIYICNVLRCRPPGNRLPSLEEAGHCREFLDAQIALVNPEYIVCWGSTAAKNLLRSEATIGKLRGQFFSYGCAKVLCTYHPSYLLRNPAAKKDVWEDMRFLFRDMGVDLTSKV
jgi:DNA polymerase